MTFWLIAVPSAVALCALIWWSSGRAKPDLRKRSFNTELGIRQGESELRSPGGPVDWSGGAGF